MADRDGLNRNQTSALPAQGGAGSGPVVAPKFDVAVAWSSTMSRAPLQASLRAVGGAPAVHETFRTKLPLECEDLGDHRVVRRWSLGAESFVLCELTEREARELSALLVRGSGENRMYIFSFAYLRKDPAFDLSLRRPGAKELDRK